MGRTIKNTAQLIGTAFAGALLITATILVAAFLATAITGGAEERPHAGPPRTSTTSTTTTVVDAEVRTSSTTLEAEVRTSSATLEYGSLAHVHEAYDRHLAAHATAQAAWEADPAGQDYADTLAILELRTAEYNEALAAWKAAG